MKLGTMLTLLGCVASAIPACHADAPGNQSASGNAGTTSSAGASNAGSTSSAGTTSSAAGANGLGGSSSAGANNAGATSNAGSTNNAGGTSRAGAGGATGSAGAGGASGSPGAGAGGGSGGLPALQECTGKASIDRITDWTASNGECTCTPVGDILTKEGQTEVAKVVFTGSGWHVVPVLITNQFGKTADVSSSSGITLTYSATAALHVQIRSGSHWDGGDQWATDVPSTAGTKQTLTLSFDASKWQSLFGAPAQTLVDVLKEVQGLVFVGDSANTVEFYGLRIQGFEPACP
ncbi:MAG TPA: hypothetical protein VHW01_03370 [Polyangiaceae bacterium]|jgi:hypothetical protein|nr:hypothetical protein [Polyangiaceae bacterium]